MWIRLADGFKYFTCVETSYLNADTCRFDPFSPACATFLAELCNPITRQAIELQSCSNPLRMQQVLQSKSKKWFFVLGLSFSWGNVTRRSVFALFWLFWPSLPPWPCCVRYSSIGAFPWATNLLAVSASKFAMNKGYHMRLYRQSHASLVKAKQVQWTHERTHISWSSLT